MIVLYREDGVTPLDGFAITNEEAGADSDVVPFIAKNDGDTTALNVLILQRTVSPLDPNVRLAIGAPPQDQQWGRLRIVGYDNTADPTWSVPTTDWVTAGAYATGPLVPTIPPGCWVEMEYASHPPGDAEIAPWTRSLVPLYDEYSQPVPQGLTRADRGVLHGIGDYSRSGIIYGSVNAEDTPGDTVAVLPALWLVKGRLYGKATTHPQLNQNDGAAAALASGQSYWAAISLGPVSSTQTVTKGTKATVPTKPSAPAGELVVAFVKVEYQGGGTSVIEAADIDYTGASPKDRYEAQIISGLTLRIWGGQAYGGGTWRFSGVYFDLLLANDSTLYIWQLATGLFTTTTTNAAPEMTALLYYRATTASGAITEVVDLRTYAGETVELRIRGDLPVTVGEIEDLLVGHERLVIDRLIYRLSDNGGGISGQTKLDLLINGDSVYVSSGTDDIRPAVLFDAAGADLIVDDYQYQWGAHELSEIRRGDVLSLTSVEYPTGGTPAEAEVIIICRKP